MGTIVSRIENFFYSLEFYKCLKVLSVCSSRKLYFVIAPNPYILDTTKKLTEALNRISAQSVQTQDSRLRNKKESAWKKLHNRNFQLSAQWKFGNKKLELVNLFQSCATILQTKKEKESRKKKSVVYAILMDPKYDQPVMKLFDAVASEVSQDALGQILRGCVIYLRK